MIRSNQELRKKRRTPAPKRMKGSWSESNEKAYIDNMVAQRIRPDLDPLKFLKNYLYWVRRRQFDAADPEKLYAYAKQHLDRLEGLHYSLR